MEICRMELCNGNNYAEWKWAIVGGVMQILSFPAIRFVMEICRMEMCNGIYAEWK